MWQPPGGLSSPPTLIAGMEIDDSREMLQITSENHAPRAVEPRKQGPRRLDSHQLGTVLRQDTTSEQTQLPQHGSSWVCKQRRCPDQAVRRHFRMANLYDIQYSSSISLNSVPGEVVSNVDDEDVSRRCFNKRHHAETINNHSSNDPQRDNLIMWPVKHRRYSTYNDDFNMIEISSYSTPQLLTPGISQCTTSDTSSESQIPNLFSTRIASSTITCSNPTSIDYLPINEPMNGPVAASILENSDSSSSDMSSSEITSDNVYATERPFCKKITLDQRNEVVMVEMHKLHGFSSFNLPSATVQGRKVANRVITHTRIYKIPDERAIWCLNCDRIPTLPVTGQCGHTRCSTCVKENDICPCGSPAPRSPCVNTVIQEIIDKMLQQESGNRLAVNGVGPVVDPYRRNILSSSTSAAPGTVPTRRVAGCSRMRRSANISTKKSISMTAAYEGRLPMTPQARFKRARELLARGRYRAAATHLARVAASSAPLARLARTLLAQAISALGQNTDPRRLTRELHRAVRLQSAVSWLKPADLECVLCYHTYTSPVTTPCGHTYCRTCIERSLDYRKTCALCLRPLDDFNLAATRETEFVNAALIAIDAVSSPSPPDPDVIPIFVCTVAFPSIPCPLFIFDPRYWMMIRRILESGSRKFGMVAYERDRSYSDYGTVLEVCDCVHLEDGRSILSTVGVSRFRVIERDVHDGCDVARIQPLIDVTPNEDMAWELRVMATHISYKAWVWLDSMNRAVRAEIESAFGPVPHFEMQDDELWERADGPRWLWWLIAILPLRSEIKILILSTRSLLKRMMAVSRTLEVMDSEAFTNNTNNECDLGTALSSTEEWLERSA